ncbi:ABC transporter substrate-binding protein [Nocardioides sp. GY 10127]|uniref:heme/hemin ABC transporter substrate-binding protein n=1 Tax=Nocardioides sp. GY 10127 TaxID=2569762 RepID=UPI001F0D3D9F|nr:ABC transporter substrate-binding protein [Nocardioides sp. GY 10127]
MASLLLLVPVLLAGCTGPGATSATDAAGSSGSGDAGAATPALADVGDDLLDDVRDWTGAVTATVADDSLDPVRAQTPQLPATVTDVQGTEVTVTDDSRVLALDVYGTLARTVAELGMLDSLVGRDVSTTFDEAADLPLVTTNGHQLSAEAILALDPTLIITDTSLGPWDVVLQLRDAGVPVVVVDSDRSLDNVGELTQQVAAALGVPAAGRRLARRTQAQVAEATAEIDAIAPTDESDELRIVFLYVRGQANVYYLFGEGSGADSLIDALGGYDVAEEIGWKGMRSVTSEALAAAQPDLVLMMTDGLESAGGVDGLLERLPALAATPAGENQRIVTMDDSEILGYGPLTAQVLEALAVAVYAPAAAAGADS